MAGSYIRTAGDNKFGWIQCPACDAEPKTDGNRLFHEFHDFLSAKEYAISGMCQKCQDAVFINDDDDDIDDELMPLTQDDTPAEDDEAV